jgi:hypothetical protein
MRDPSDGSDKLLGVKRGPELKHGCQSQWIDSLYRPSSPLRSQPKMVIRSALTNYTHPILYAATIVLLRLILAAPGAIPLPLCWSTRNSTGFQKRLSNEHLVTGKSASKIRNLVSGIPPLVLLTFPWLKN